VIEGEDNDGIGQGSWLMMHGLDICSVAQHVNFCYFLLLKPTAYSLAQLS
jgi:hypothetical protein